MDHGPLKAIVELHAHQISEHCDTVQIFVTKHVGEDTETASYEYGVGNFLARFGQVVEWRAIQDQYQREEAKRRDKRDNTP